MTECCLKKLDGLQESAGHLAIGVLHPLGSGDPALMSEGTDPLGKKYTAMPELSHCTIQHGKCQQSMRHQQAQIGQHTSIDPATIGIETRPKRIILGRPHSTSLISRVCSRTISASHNGPRDIEHSGIGRSDGAPGIGVDRRLVVGVVVDTFDDINLTIDRPVGTVCPDYK